MVSTFNRVQKGGRASKMIKFNELSGWLKLAIISAWVNASIYGYYFLEGFLYAL
jgi:hypothetical protein